MDISLYIIHSYNTMNAILNVLYNISKIINYKKKKISFHNLKYKQVVEVNNVNLYTRII